MVRDFPRIEVPSGLHVDHKKVLVFLLIYEAGYYEIPEGYQRNRILLQLGKHFPSLVLEPTEHVVKLKEFMDKMKAMRTDVAAQAYQRFTEVAKANGLWKILKPLESRILGEVKSCLHDGSVITEVDWLQIVFDLKVNTPSDQQYYREYVLQNGYDIVQSIPEFDEIAEEFNANDSETLPNKEVIRLFQEMGKKETTPERQREIKNILFNANKRLVPFVLEKMRSFANYTPARDRDDDLQEGLSALWWSLEKFDVTKGNQFSTYAVQCIRGNILRFRNKNRFLQHVPENQNLNYQKAVKVKNRKEAELGREITVQEWARLMQMPEYKLTKLLDIHKETVYFGSPVHSSSEDLLLEEIISDTINLEDEILDMAMSYELSNVLSRLEQRDEDIVRMRTGFYHTRQELLHAQMKLGREVHPNEVITFEEIARAYGITRERVRQIWDTAIHTLKHPTISKQILNYHMEMDDESPSHVDEHA